MGKDLKSKLREAHIAGQTFSGATVINWPEAEKYAEEIISGVKQLSLDEALKQPVSPTQLEVLRWFAERFDHGERVWFMRHVSAELGMESRRLRVAVRALNRKSLLNFGQAYDECEGKFCGSGYFCSVYGDEYVRKFDESREKKELAKSQQTQILSD